MYAIRSYYVIKLGDIFLEPVQNIIQIIEGPLDFIADPLEPDTVFHFLTDVIPGVRIFRSAIG